VQIVNVPITSLKEYPGNARRGDVEAIAESLRTNGQFQPLIVQESTRYILIGNHTLKAARDHLRWPDIDAAFLDVDDMAARKIVLAANRTADLATYDLDDLQALLHQVDDLEGTGYTADDLSGLDDADEGETTSSERDRDTSTRLGVVVYCDTEEEQLLLLEVLLEEGRNARAL
jgi:ParB-like chromosome segregation protein Spo0J